MTTQLNATPALTRLNPFVDPTPWNRVQVAGILIAATAVKFNGMKIEDSWKQAKSRDSSGAVFSFTGTNPVGGESGFSITFRVVSDAEWDQLYDIWNALAPVAVFGGGATGGTSTAKVSPTAAGSPSKPDDASAETLLAQAQAALNSLNSPTPAPSSVDPAAAAQAASTPTPSPGPRPPTVPITLGWLNFLGVFAVARKSWEFSTVEQDKIEVTIGFVQNAPPKPAGTGAMGAPKPAVSVGAGFVQAANAISASASASGT